MTSKNDYDFCLSRLFGIRMSYDEKVFKEALWYFIMEDASLRDFFDEGYEDNGWFQHD